MLSRLAREALKLQSLDVFKTSLDKSPEQPGQPSESTLLLSKKAAGLETSRVISVMLDSTFERN